MSTLSTALRPCSFANMLFARPPLTLGEMLDKAAEFIIIEEMQVVPKRQHEENISSLRQEKKEGKKTFVPNERIKGKTFKDGPKWPRFDRYSPLNVPRVRILEEALSGDLLPSLKKKLTPKNADGTKHCLYHQNTGHTTEHCTTLKDKVEELLRDRTLEEVRENRAGKKPSEEGEI
ncbi:uncharacterized protein HKW66_Vig0245850 [Vigna angularis]|uniref:Uncharacterized protein n=1 Tax=Phaseolus angularis TaxID=3914 RepID=A0A8T0KCN3_PHAAN|nr:uncharacterized protein HKW66_Vig0245850 [Vigna angularis]